MDLRQIPARPSVEQYKKQAKDLLRLLRSSDERAWLRLKDNHPLASARGSAGEVSLADAQLVVAREHGFESWPKFARQLEQLARGNGAEYVFESAVDAVVGGDVEQLRSLLERDPGLARARSPRVHAATLLHYVAANGVEDFRQKCPPNALDVARSLIHAGADVNATANMYGHRASVLDMLVSSVHPHAAGVQGALTELLLDHGADVGGALMTALAFGYPDTAQIIAQRTGIDNVVAAAGLGQLDIVSRMLDADGRLNSETKLVRVPGVADLAVEPKMQLEQALIGAARYNHSEVVAFLLDRGVDSGARGSEGFTALHWAVFYGHTAALRALLARNAPLEARNVYGATVLGTAVWASANRSPLGGVDYAPIVAQLLEAGADVKAAGGPSGNPSIDETLSRYGAVSD
jgi:ankyrin repeat protein